MRGFVEEFPKLGRIVHKHFHLSQIKLVPGEEGWIQVPVGGESGVQVVLGCQLRVVATRLFFHCVDRHGSLRIRFLNGFSSVAA